MKVLWLLSDDECADDAQDFRLHFGGVGLCQICAKSLNFGASSSSCGRWLVTQLLLLF